MLPAFLEHFLLDGLKQQSIREGHTNVWECNGAAHCSQ